MLRVYVLLAFICGIGNSRAADPVPETPLTKAVAPLVDSETWLVARLDLTRIDLAKAAGLLRGVLPLQEEMGEFENGIKQWQDAFRKGGGKEVYFSYGGSDFPQRPCFFVPIADWREGKELAELFRLFGGTDLQSTRFGNFLAIGTPTALANVKLRKSVDRGDLATALEAVEKYPISLAISPSAGARKIVEELAPNLPKELGGGSSEVLTRGLKWIAIAIDEGPHFTFRTLTQCTDKTAAGKMADIWSKAVDQLGSESTPEGSIAVVYPKWFKKVVADLSPRVESDRVTVTVESNKFLPELALLAKEITGGAERVRSTNNLKQIALALHNYHDTYGHFPADVRNAKGEAILSWRVLILPYLENEPLFKEFKLDEPWDSESNKKLIARMPKILRSPRQDAKLGAKTTYLAPLGKGLMWDEPKGLKISEVLDGTSNTVFVVEADDERAVVWTKPDDLPIDAKNPAQGLLGHYQIGFLAVMADGSVRMFPKTQKNLYDWFTRAGGEVVSYEKK